PTVDASFADLQGTAESVPIRFQLPTAVARENRDGDVPFQGNRNAPGSAVRTAPSIPGYDVLGELGRGGMGVVYKARRGLLNRDGAWKMILAGPHPGTELVARFLAEAAAVAKLRHPNIVQIYGVGEAQGCPYLELEYVDGGSLAHRLDGTPWPA